MFSELSMVNWAQFFTFFRMRELVVCFRTESCEQAGRDIAASFKNKRTSTIWAGYPSPSVCIVRSFHWASACFQLSMCIFSVELVHTLSWACADFTWACACFQLSLCTYTLEHVHVFFFHILAVFIEHLHSSSWAYVCFQLSMCMFSFKHVNAFSWACALL